MKKLLVTLTLAIIALAGCGSASDEGVVLKIATPQIETLDVTLATYEQTFEVYASIYECLYTINETGEIVPAGAASMPVVSEDGLTYSIMLNEDAIWADNTGEVQRNVVANDYVVAWQRMLDPEVGAAYSYIYDIIEGYEAALAGDGDKLGIKAISDTELEITLKHPAPHFTEMLVFYPFAPLAPELLNEAYGTTGESVWYNGPFYLDAYDNTGIINAVKSPGYWDVDNVELDGVKYITMDEATTEFNAFQAGEVDVSVIPGPEQLVTANTDFPEHVVFKPSSGTMVLYQNTEGEYTSNVNFRKALQHAVNTTAIAQEIIGGGVLPATTFVPGELTEGSYGVNFKDLTGDLSSYDEVLAKEYLALATSEMGVSASDISIDLLVSSSVTSDLPAYLQSQLESILGITVNIDSAEQNSFYDQVDNGFFDLCFSGWIADYGDAGSFLGLFKSMYIGGLNTSRYTNDEYDVAFDKANQIVDGDERNAAFAALETHIVKDEAALIPLYHRGNNGLVRDTFNMPTHPFYIVSSKFITTN